MKLGLTLFPLCQVLRIDDLNGVQGSCTSLVLVIVAVHLNTPRHDHDILEVVPAVEPSAAEHAPRIRHLWTWPPGLTGQIEYPSGVGRYSVKGLASCQEHLVFVGLDGTHAREVFRQVRTPLVLASLQGRGYFFSSPIIVGIFICFQSHSNFLYIFSMKVAG